MRNVINTPEFIQLKEKYEELTYLLDSSKVFPFILESFYAHSETFKKEDDDYNVKLAIYDLSKIQKMFIDDINKRYQEIDQLFFNIEMEGNK